MANFVKCALSSAAAGVTIAPMSFFWESRTYQSEKNGMIHCRRFLGRWRVTVDGFDQTTSYTNRMWKRALRRVPKKSGVKRVLLLGLGAGGALSYLHQRFHHATVTAIEWDPIMITIADELGFFPREQRPRIMQGDAVVLVPQLTEKFDLIIVDLFRGKKVDAALNHTVFIAGIACALDQEGFLLVNIFGEPEMLTRFDDALSCHATWRFRYNRLALYRHFGRGHVGDPLPAGYVTRKQSVPYLQGDWSAKSAVELIGREECWGMRWRHGPLTFEGYESDEEPAITPGPSRMVIWQPLTRRDKPPGWHRSFIQMNYRRTGVAEITDPENYTANWSNHAKRHLRKWQRIQPYHIEETQHLDEFVRAHRATKKLWLIKSDFIHMVERRKVVHGEDTRLFVARNDGGGVVAGFAAIDLPALNQSYHLISFIHADAEHTSVGTGLMDHWFRHAIARGLRFLDFGVFWTWGDPLDWRGFSRFKSQFGIYYTHRPYPLVKFVRAN